MLAIAGTLERPTAGSVRVGRARRRRPVRAGRAPSGRTVRRRVPARRHRPGPGRAARHHPGRRADRQPGLGGQRGHPHPAGRAEPRGRDDPGGHPQPGDSRGRAPGDPAARRADRARQRGGMRIRLEGPALPGEPPARRPTPGRSPLLGLVSRPARAALSAVGVALGIATMVAVLGISELQPGPAGGADRRAGHQPAHRGSGPVVRRPDTSRCRREAPAMVAQDRPGHRRRGHRRRERPRCTGTTGSPRRTPTRSRVYAADARPAAHAAGAARRGAASSTPPPRGYPAVVLGADAATALGIDRTGRSSRSGWATGGSASSGSCGRLPLAPELDRTALIGYPVARAAAARRRGAGRRSTCAPTRPASPRSAAVLPATADPAAPQDVDGRQPDHTRCTARADASVAFQETVPRPGRGGASGRRRRHRQRHGHRGARTARRDRPAAGARRAPGSTSAVQFAAEATLLAGCGGVAGAVLGGFATDRLRGGAALGRGAAGAGAARRGGHRPAGGGGGGPVSGAARGAPCARRGAAALAVPC